MCRPRGGQRSPRKGPWTQNAVDCVTLLGIEWPGVEARADEGETLHLTASLLPAVISQTAERLPVTV